MPIIIYAFQDVYKKTHKAYIIQMEKNSTTIKVLL